MFNYPVDSKLNPITNNNIIDLVCVCVCANSIERTEQRRKRIDTVKMSNLIGIKGDKIKIRVRTQRNTLVYSVKMCYNNDKSTYANVWNMYSDTRKYSLLFFLDIFLFIFKIIRIVSTEWMGGLFRTNQRMHACLPACSYARINAFDSSIA